LNNLSSQTTEPRIGFEESETCRSGPPSYRCLTRIGPAAILSDDSSGEPFTMPHRFALTSVALLTALGLAGCNASPQPSASLQAGDSADATPPDFHLPAGEACTGEIDRYATLVYSDNQTGMVDTSVFDQIKVEIGKAVDVCRAGQDAQARALVADSKHKHGYPS
jgi:hypothetical protein